MRPLLSLAAPLVATAALLLAQALAGEALLSKQFAPLPPLWQQVVLAWITVCTALLAASGWRAATGGSWSNAVRLRRTHPVAVICSVLIGGALWVLVQWVVASQRTIIPEGMLDRWDSDMIEHSKNAFALLSWNTPSTLAVSLLAGAFAPAFAEELMYRGLLVESGTQSGVPTAATLIASALLFAAIHFSLPMLLPMTALGIGLAALSLRSGSVVPAIVAHLTFNAISIALLPLMGGEPNVSAPLVPENSLPLFLLAATAVVGLLLLLRFVGRYNNAPAEGRTPA